jgi:outer membrane protein TolC
MCLTLVLLAGCVAYHPQPLQPVNSEAELRARSPLDSGLQRLVRQRFTNTFPVWPPAQFDLTALTMIALYFHPDLALARARVAAAQAGEITAGARPNPTLSVLPTRVFNSFPGEVPWLMTVSLDVPIETAGKRGHRLEQSRQTTRAARLALAETAWAVRSRLRAALVEYFDAGSELESFRHEAELTGQWSAALERRLAAGDISRFDLTLAQNESLNAQLALSAAQTRHAAARAALAAALGLPLGALDQLPMAWPEFERPEPDFSTANLQEAGLLNRLDIQRALAEYAAIEAALQLAVANQYPDLHLDPGYEFDQGEHKFSLGPTVTLPLLDRNRGPIAEAAARRNEAAASFLALQSDALHEMEAAQLNYRAAVEAWQTTDRIATDLQQRIEKATERELQVGETDRAALLQVRLQSSAAGRARLAAIRKVQDALGALENAVQRPLSEEADWRSISGWLAQNPPPKTSP